MLTLAMSLGLMALLIVAAAAGIALNLRRARRLRYEATCLADRIFGQTADAPSIELKSVYSWPAFALVFPTQEARLLYSSRGSVREFASQLQSIVASTHRRGPAFDVERALWVTSVPERQEQLEKAAAYARNRT